MDPVKRFTIDDIIKHDWITDGGKIQVEVEKVEEFKDGRDGFGNLQRAITTKGMFRGTVKNLDELTK